jgi:hypothetical protein
MPDDNSPIVGRQPYSYAKRQRTWSICVMVRDLPFSCANQDVSNLCHEMLAPLVHAIFDTKGCPLHYGYILFDTADNAHQAIS